MSVRPVSEFTAWVTIAICVGLPLLLCAGGCGALVWLYGFH